MIGYVNVTDFYWFKTNTATIAFAVHLIPSAHLLDLFLRFFSSSAKSIMAWILDILNTSLISSPLDAGIIHVSRKLRRPTDRQVGTYHLISSVVLM